MSFDIETAETLVREDPGVWNPELILRDPYKLREIALLEDTEQVELPPEPKFALKKESVKIECKPDLPFLDEFDIKDIKPTKKELIEGNSIFLLIWLYIRVALSSKILFKIIILLNLKMNIANFDTTLTWQQQNFWF